MKYHTKITRALTAALAAILPAAHAPGTFGAVVNTKALAVQNADAVPVVMNKTYLSGGRVYEAVGVVEVQAADDDTSVLRLFRVWSGDRISSIELGNDAITGGTSYDMGVYDTQDNGGGAVSAALFATALDMTVAKAMTEQTYEASFANIDKIEKQLWELLGLSADPKKYYDICLRANTIGTVQGTIAGRLRYLKGA